MSNLVLRQNILPTNIEDLSKFALVGRERLTAVRAEIRAIDKLKLANDVKEQKLQEAQNIAEIVLDAEIKIGELLKAIPKETNNNPNGINQHSRGQKSSTAPLTTAKEQTKKDIGISNDQAKRYIKLAENKEVIEQVKAEARQKGEIVTRQAVFALAEETKKPHISNNSGNNEWYTPQEYIEAAKAVMGNIDLDPASSDIANEVIKADKYFTIKDDGLSKDWNGRVWLNPPYATELIPLFINKLKNHVENDDITDAIVLVNNATETAWFNNLIGIASAIVFPKSRVRFYMPDGKTGAPLQGQAVIYIGENSKCFMEIFSPFGWGAFI